MDKNVVGTYFSVVLHRVDTIVLMLLECSSSILNDRKVNLTFTLTFEFDHTESRCTSMPKA